MQYTAIYDVFSKDVDKLIGTQRYKAMIYSEIRNYSRNRNSVNEELNLILTELMADPDDSNLIRPFVDEIIKFMQQDVMLVGKQYISFEEALYLVVGEG